MSVYKPKGSEIFVYDFQWRGHRFSGSTGAKSKRQAEQIERGERDKAKRAADKAASINSSPITLDVACGRYWDEVGQHAKSSSQIEWSIDYLLKHFGEDKPLREITDADVANLVAKRRADFVENFLIKKHRVQSTPKRVSSGTVNRSVTEPLRRIMLRARDVWGKEVGRVNWRQHKLKEPKERIRSMSDDEETRFFAKLAPGYVAITTFAMRTGCRAMECINLKWSDIDWGNRRITILGKGNKIATIPMPIDVRDLLFPMQENGSLFVFTLPSSKHGEVRRITYRGFYSAFYDATRRAGVVNFRIHDLRHTAATRVVRATGNLKMAQKLLRHEDISTTAKYAAVLDDDLRDALDAMAAQKVPGKVPAPTANSLGKKTNR